MDPNYPYQPYSSGTAQTGGYYPTTSAPPTSTEAGPTGEVSQQQGAAQPGYYGDPQAAPPISHVGPQTAPLPGPYDSYGGPQTGYVGSHRGSQAHHSHQYGYQHQPQTYQQTSSNDLVPYNLNSGPRPGAAPIHYNTFPANQPAYPQQHGMPPPGHGGPSMPPPSTGQTAPSVAAVDEPANPGTSGGSGAQDPQASGGQTRPGYPNEDARAEWSLRSNWIFEAGMLVDHNSYTVRQFRGDYHIRWRGVAVPARYRDVWSEFEALRLQYLGY